MVALDGVWRAVYAWHMSRGEGHAAPEARRQARLFRNGRNQALRIPRDLEFPGDTVILHKEDDRLIVEPLTIKRTLAEILPGLESIPEEFPEIADPPAQPEDIL
ncbi:MAG: AbrB/MazE/SpoVT family DNA-binding domain-containing protein [Spirochaetaceae bacterium]|nr:AbrB/MazE/SpoVT family DNA-binding domain-containing protein [Spirochaetaceae bacterium]